MEEKRDVPIEFRLDALEEELFRLHEDVLEAENVSWLPRGHHAQQLLSEYNNGFGMMMMMMMQQREQKQKRKRDDDGGDLKDDDDAFNHHHRSRHGREKESNGRNFYHHRGEGGAATLALQRAPYTLAEAHGVDEMEKKASARSSQPSSSFPAKKKSGGSFKSKKKSFGSFGNLAGAAGGGKSFQGGGGKKKSALKQHKGGAPTMLTKTKTSSWWRWAEEVFRRVGANDVARVLPTKNWRDDQALKIPPIGNRNGMMIFDYDNGNNNEEGVNEEERLRRAAAGAVATTSGQQLPLQHQQAPALGAAPLLLLQSPFDAFKPLGEEATRATQSFDCLQSDEIRELCFAFLAMSREIGSLLRKESDDEEDDEDDDEDKEDEDIAASFLEDIFNGDKQARDRWMKAPAKKVASRSSSRTKLALAAQEEEKELTEDDLIVMRARIWLSEIVVKIVERRKQAIENHGRKFDKDVVVVKDTNNAGVGYGANAKLMGATVTKKRKGAAAKKGKKSAWTTKAKQLKQQEEEKQQQKQLLLLQQQEAQIKLEEAEKANARGMSGSSFMETKEEILAKKVQLENRIRATFGASGDHDAVERIALGEAAHPHTLQLMQTAFTTPEFTATIEKEEETPSRQRKIPAGRRGAKGNKSASKRAKACALCEKGSDHAKATCGTDEAQFRCEKLRERIKDESMEKKRKAEEALEDVAAECAEEMKEKKSASKTKKRKNEKTPARKGRSHEETTTPKVNKTLKSPFSPDTNGKVKFPSLAVVPMQRYGGDDEDKSESDEEDDPTAKDAKDELKRLQKYFSNNPELVSCAPCDDVENELLTCQYELLYQINANRSNLTKFFQEITGKIEEEATWFENRYVGISEANAFVNTIREARRKEKREKRARDQQQAFEKAAAAAEESKRQAFRRHLGEQVAAATGNPDVNPDQLVIPEMPDESANVSRPRRGVALANAALQVLGLRGKVAGFFGTSPKANALESKQSSFTERSLDKNADHQNNKGIAIGTVDARNLFQLLDPLHASTSRTVLDVCNVCANSCCPAKVVKDKTIYRCLGCDVTVHDECYGVLSEKNEKHKSFVCDVCAHNHGSGYGSWPDAQKRTAHSPLLTSADEKLRAQGQSVSCILCPAKLGAMKKASLTLPVSQRANQQNSTTTAWVHVSCAELVRGATTNPFADSVEINPTVFGGTIHFSGTPTNRAAAQTVAVAQPPQIDTPILSNSCTLCYSRRGGCAATCAFGSCRARFHLCCARAAGWHARFSDGSTSSKRQPRAYCDRHSPIQREKDESKGVQVAKLSLTDNENEVMVQTVRASADGKRGKVSMLSALRAMQRSMRLECESAHNQGGAGVVTANALGLGVGTTSNSAGLLQHQSSYSSDASFLDGILPNKLPPTSNPDLSHPGSNGGTPKKARSTAYARGASRGKRGSVRASRNGSRAPATALMSDEEAIRENSTLPEGWAYVPRETLDK